MRVQNNDAGTGRCMRWAFVAVLVGVLAFALSGQSAAADDGPLIDGGFYGGVQAGYAVPDARFSLGGSGLGDLRAEGFRAGGFVGYAVRHGDLIGAVELDGGFATGDGALQSAGTAFKIEPRYTAGLSLFAGTVVGERGVLYARAGYQALIVDASLAGTDTTEVLHGARIGAGAGVALTDRVSLRAEYVYTFFGDKDYDAGASTLNVESEQGVVRVGVVFGF